MINNLKEAHEIYKECLKNNDLRYLQTVLYYKCIIPMNTWELSEKSMDDIAKNVCDL